LSNIAQALKVFLGIYRFKWQYVCPKCQPTELKSAHADYRIWLRPYPEIVQNFSGDIQGKFEK
jgi:hypothetical protein